MFKGTFTKVQLISETITQCGFYEILSVLHFNDNNSALPATSLDRKIQPIIEFFNTRFNEVAISETKKAVNEIMPFKGKHSAKMYMAKKPMEWGNKLWCRPGISGYVYDFDVIGDKVTKGTPDNIQSHYVFGESQHVVLRLVNNLQPNKLSLFQQSS